MFCVNAILFRQPLIIGTKMQRIYIASNALLKILKLTLQLNIFDLKLTLYRLE